MNRVFDKLGGLDAELRLAAADAALPVAEGQDAVDLITQMLELSQAAEERPWVMRAQRVWAQLTAKQDITTIQVRARQLLTLWGWKGAAELYPAIAGVVAQEWMAHHAEPVTREGEDEKQTDGMLRLAERSGCGVLAPALASLVLQGESGVARRAARLMQAMAEQAVGEESDRYRAALAGLCERFDEHRIGAVLLAALHALTPSVRRMDENDELLKWFARMTRDPSPALIAVLRSRPDAVITLRAWEWMRFGKLAQACAERCGAWFDSPDDPEAGAEGVLSPASWAAHPCRQRAGWRSDAVCEWIAQGGDAGWSASCMADRGSPEVGAAMVRGSEPRGLLRLAMDGTGEACLDIALIGPAATAGLAVERLTQCGQREVSPWHALSRSPLTEVRQQAAAQTAWRGDWRGAAGVAGIDWRTWMDAASIGVRTNISAGESPWIELGSRIEEADARHAMLALTMVKRVGCVDLVEHAVLTRLRAELKLLKNSTGDARLTAMLVNAMGGIASRATVHGGAGDAISIDTSELLREAMSCSNARVRSNAIEVACRRQRRGIKEVSVDLGHCVADQENRPRATAVRELVRTMDREHGSTSDAVSQAIDESLALLTDHRATHRLSGAWVSERVLASLGTAGALGRWGEVCDRLVEIADRDAESVVRRRAHAATQRLRAEIWVRSRRDGLATAGSGVNGNEAGARP